MLYMDITLKKILSWEIYGSIDIRVKKLRNWWGKNSVLVIFSTFLLNALVNTACGADWVSLHNGGGVGIGNSTHAGQVIVATGTKEKAIRLQRVLDADPMMGIFRHVDAGYDEAKDFAKKHNVNIPSTKKIEIERWALGRHKSKLWIMNYECPTIIFTPNEVEGLNIEIARHEMPGLESTEYHNPELVDGLNK